MNALLRRITRWLTGEPAATTPRLRILVGDITAQKVDVIVNAAKSSLLGGGGVDGAIHRKGGSTILAECHAIRLRYYQKGLPTGAAVATTAGDLDASWVVHTVGPVYSPGIDQTALLRACYTESLRVADGLKAETVAFPLISAGVYGWPKRSAIVEALLAIRSVKLEYVKHVRLVLFSDEELRIAGRLENLQEDW